VYHVLLTNRYLTTRVIPLIAVAAVALCVALVIIVVSVMSGFLDMVRSSGRILMGDVIVQYPVHGIPLYEDLIAEIEALPVVHAATPVVDSWGLLQMPYPDGPNKETEMVQIWGIDAESFAKVTGYEETLYWREVENWQWLQLLNDLIDRDWQVIRDLLSDEQRLSLMREMVHLESPEMEMPPDESILREIADTLEDEQWRHVIRFAGDHPEVLRRVLDEVQWQEFLARDPRLLESDSLLRQALTLRDARTDRPGIVLGMHVSQANVRGRDGSYRPMGNGYWWMLRHEVTLTTIPIDTTGGLIEPESFIFPVLNEFVSGVFLIDDTRVMVPIDIAQRMLHLDKGQLVDPVDPAVVIGEYPARATMVLVRGRDGVSPIDLRERVFEAYNRFRARVQPELSEGVRLPVAGFEVHIRTWEQQQARFIGPVENERNLMRFLFSTVYLVCGGLVLAIFWAIVHEKTRDIGILRSIGASQEGILWIFIRYGLATSTVGSLLGLLLGYIVVRNVNPIHDALGEPPRLLAVLAMVPCVLAFLLIALRCGVSGILFAAIGCMVVGLVSGGIFGTLYLTMDDPAGYMIQHWEYLLAAIAISFFLCVLALTRMLNIRALVTAIIGTFTIILSVALAAVILYMNFAGGLVMWNPEVYYFETIPNTIDWRSALGTVLLAISFSALGAAIAAAKAADTDPVQALRYE
jgi:lipoprotein-releasing system permease protein